MKLHTLNENHKEDEEFDDALDKYRIAKGRGNINKHQAEDDADKTEQPDRSGNQYTPATTDKDKLDLLGASGNSKDKQSPPNLTKPNL